MHLSTAAEKYIIPKLADLDGSQYNAITLLELSKRIKELTGTRLTFRCVNRDAFFYAMREKEAGKTFSFNITTTDMLMNEMEQSSKSRRDRFRHLFSNINMTKEQEQSRLGITLNSISGDVNHTVNYMVHPTGEIEFLAVMGFYGSSINSWVDRFGIKETERPHSVPSTHYMPADQAFGNLVYLLKRITHLCVVK